MMFRDLLALDDIDAKKSKDVVKLYRAYLLTNDDDMVFNVDGDLVYPTLDAAVANLLNRIDEGMSLKGSIISFLVINLPVKSNKDLDLLPGREKEYDKETKSIAIAIKNLDYTLDVMDMRVDSIDYNVDSKTEIKRLISCEMSKI